MSQNDPQSNGAGGGSSSARSQSWYANCATLAHPSGATWTGPKRSVRRQAIKDATEHNKQYSHHAEVLGPTD